VSLKNRLFVKSGVDVQESGVDVQESGVDVQESGIDVQETQPDYQSIRETAVRAQATNNHISDTCQTALESVECEMQI
jgi:hypothetical protein